MIARSDFGRATSVNPACSNGPPPAGPPPPPVAPTPRPPRRGFPWLLVGGAVVLLVAVIAATAAITYADARRPAGTGYSLQATITPPAGG